MKTMPLVIVVLIFLGGLLLLSGQQSQNETSASNTSISVAHPGAPIYSAVASEENRPTGNVSRLASDGNADLVISLSSDKPSYLLGEPVVLWATLTNQGAQTVEVIPIFDPTYGFVHYNIIYPDGTSQGFSPLWLNEGIPRPYMLAGSKSVIGNVRLFYGSKGLTFQKPGAYTIVGEYAGLTSAPISLNIESPKDSVDIDAANLMLADNVGRFIFLGGGEHLMQAHDQLLRVTQKYPDSILAGYANYALGIYYSQNARDFKANQIRPADFDLAGKYLDKALGTPLPSYYRINSYATIVKVNVDHKQPAMAIDVLKRFESEFAGDARAIFAIDQAKTYIR